MFSCKFVTHFQNTFSWENLSTAASEDLKKIYSDGPWKFQGQVTILKNGHKNLQIICLETEAAVRRGSSKYVFVKIS